jgi:hypothetical protein
MIFLGVAAGAGLRGRVSFAEVVTHSWSVDLSAYPRWLVVLAGTMIVAVVLWILMKLLKWALWLLIIGVLLGGFFWAGWELMQ